jgi:hypothetical protein
MNFTLYDLIGSIGVGIIILTYILLQTERLKSENLSYSILNALGSGMIAFSLIFKFNLAAFVVETLWLVISLYGIVKYFLKRS